MTIVDNRTFQLTMSYNYIWGSFGYKFIIVVDNKVNSSIERTEKPAINISNIILPARYNLNKICMHNIHNVSKSVYYIY